LAWAVVLVIKMGYHEGMEINSCLATKVNN
jgi:hypothetical protein